MMRRVLPLLNGLISTLLIGAAITLSTVSVQAEPQTDVGAQLIGLGGTTPEMKSVEIDTAHVYDYTFASAPTDWRTQSGVWEMTNRWSCSPGWSWFGGRSEEVAAVWNKRRFKGDLSVQFYFSFKMGLAGTPRWNYHPSDVAISFCGDGQNLGSGYSFIVGADGNRHSVLLRGDKIVAESREKAALLPAMSDGQPSTNELHRHWWYVRINKIGSRVEGWLENQLIFTYNDPKPFDAGQIALWTYNNGIMLSRVQIYYEQELRPEYKKNEKKNPTLPAISPATPATPAPVAKPVPALARR